MLLDESAPSITLTPALSLKGEGEDPLSPVGRGLG